MIGFSFAFLCGKIPSPVTSSILEERMGPIRIVALIRSASWRLSFPLLGLLVLAGLSCAQSALKSSRPNDIRHYDIKVSDLPAPEVLTGPRNNSRVIPRPEGAELSLPP